MGARLSEEEANKVMLAAKLKPLVPYINSVTPWKCKCLVCNLTVKVELQRVKYSNRGCPECGKQRSKTHRLHSKEFAYNAMLAVGWRPLSNYDGKNNKSLWKSECIKCGEISEPQLGNVLAGRSHCGFCKGNKVNPKKAGEIMLESSLKPLVKYPGAGSAWKSKCMKCLQIVYPRFADVKYGIGCAFCSGTRVNIKDAEKLMKKAKLKPLVKFQGVSVPWRCKCLKCNREVSPTYNNVQQGSGGCIFCAKGGIQYDKPAFIYLLTHREFQSIKIGISGHSSRALRLQSHRKYGWEVFKTIDIETGIDAERIETNVLKWIRNDLGLGIHLPKEFMPQGGHSETVDASEIALPTIWAKVEELSRVKR
jgi:hypothetical protein